MGGEGPEPAQRVVGETVGGDGLARRAARPRQAFLEEGTFAQADIGEVGDGSDGADRLEGAEPRHRRLQRQLRGEQRARLLGAWRRAGLEVEDLHAAVPGCIDAVGLAGEHHADIGELEAALQLGVARGDARIPLALPFGDMGGEDFQARPPDGLDLRRQRLDGEFPPRDDDERGVGAFPSGFGHVTGKMREDPVVERAALRGARRADQRLQRFQAQHALGVDRIGVAEQPLDLGDGEAPQATFQRRPGRGTGGTRLVAGFVERTRIGEVRLTLGAQLLAAGWPGKRQQPLQPARRNRRRAVGTQRPRHHHARDSHRHPEIVGGEADAALRRVEQDLRAHQPRQEGVALGALRPAALVEAAEDHQIDVLEPRFERAPDEGAAGEAGARAHGHIGGERGEDVRPFGGGDRKAHIRRGDEFGEEPRERRARLLGIEVAHAALLVRRQRFEAPGQSEREGADLDRRRGEKRRQRRQSRRQRLGRGFAEIAIRLADQRDRAGDAHFLRINRYATLGDERRE